MPALVVDETWCLTGAFLPGADAAPCAGNKRDRDGPLRPHLGAWQAGGPAR